MSNEQIKVAFLMADYGHDPTAIPFQTFKSSNFSITILTETGTPPKCDTLMLKGWTQTLLGADRSAVKAYDLTSQSEEWLHPKAWNSLSSLEDFDLVFLPGGHDKGVRQLLDSIKAQELVAGFWPSIRTQNSDGVRGRKVVAAVCHGVQLLAHAKGIEGEGKGRSLLHDVTTTALPAAFESVAYQGTRMVLGDYYKTYGAGTASVERVVRGVMGDEGRQWRGSLNPGKALVVEDEGYNYLSGRWPGDAQLLADRTVELVKKVRAA